MKEQLLTLLPDLKKAIESGVAYAGDLFNRAVMFYKIQEFIWLGFDLIFISLSPLFIKWVIRGINADYNDDDKDKKEVIGIIGALLLFVSILCFVCLFFNAINIIKLYTVPELYIFNLLNT